MLIVTESRFLKPSNIDINKLYNPNREIGTADEIIMTPVMNIVLRVDIMPTLLFGFYLIQVLGSMIHSFSIVVHRVVQ